MTTSTALLLADLLGVAVFAASGASAAVVKRLDIFGVVFVGFVAALGGGIFRDLVIDEVPPLAFADWRYAVTAAVTAGAVFWLHPQLARLRTAVLVLDAAGLGLFTVTGTLKALDADVPPVGAVLIGMLSGIGGGLGRDLLTGEIPVMLRREIYALAALAGAIVVVSLGFAGVTGPLPLVGAMVLVFGLRLVALRRRWSAPVAVIPERAAGTTPAAGPPARRRLWGRADRTGGGTARAGAAGPAGDPTPGDDAAHSDSVASAEGAAPGGGVAPGGAKAPGGVGGHRRV
ncbi:putative membrane protein YeiH [Micromonospora pisi]|uniref:Putative membrane protein YeiH n=1 Tax=Micromonospora pisi TaxID=589240 RepID=A0A495JPP1_9ACTN|nr:putative membrane protein YeiH [Micromonospora pisi]